MAHTNANSTFLVNDIIKKKRFLETHKTAIHTTCRQLESKINDASNFNKLSANKKKYLKSKFTTVLAIDRSLISILNNLEKLSDIEEKEMENQVSAEAKSSSAKSSSAKSSSTKLSSKSGLDKIKNSLHKMTSNQNVTTASASTATNQKKKRKIILTKNEIMDLLNRNNIPFKQAQKKEELYNLLLAN
jgi:hypothetical protein